MDRVAQTLINLSVN